MTAPAHAPSSITPIPLPDPPPRAARSTKAIGVAGLLLGGLSWLGNLVSSVGGLPEVVKAASQLLAQGWRPALGLVAVAAYLVLVRLLAESRAERQTMQAGVIEAIGHLSRAMNQLIAHAAAEDHAHQRNTAQMDRLDEAIRLNAAETAKLREAVSKLTTVTEVAVDITQAKTDPGIRPALVRR